MKANGYRQNFQPVASLGRKDISSKTIGYIKQHRLETIGSKVSKV